MTVPDETPKPAPAPLDPSTSEEQLRRWVLGDPVHRNDDNGGECCPDFSCCRPELLAPPEVRQAFAAAGQDDRMAFLGAFLGGVIQAATEEREAAGGKPLGVYIAGQGGPARVNDRPPLGLVPGGWRRSTSTPSPTR